jgi:serine/threonine protein kinase
MLQISDLGFARMLDSQVITPGIGSGKFRAPEAEGGSYTMTCDVWSYGILIGELSKPCDFSSSEIQIPDCSPVEWSAMRARVLRVDALGFIEKRTETEFSLLRDLANDCLEWDPLHRLTFSEICPKFKETPKPSQKPFIEFKDHINTHRAKSQPRSSILTHSRKDSSRDLYLEPVQPAESSLKSQSSEDREYSILLASAAESGNVNTVKLLLSFGVPASAGMVAAATAGNEAIVKILLAAGAKPEEGIVAAIKAGHKNLLDLLGGKLNSTLFPEEEGS